MTHRFVGIDAGTETIKVAELTRQGSRLEWTGRWMVEHGKEPGQAIVELLGRLSWDGVSKAAVCGRFGSMLRVPRVPDKQARAAGYRFLGGPQPATLVSIGAHGFSVLELRPDGLDLLRTNSRCSQGTGNFLRQLIERLGLSIAEADALCHSVEQPAPLSGRCPVILKTDMTHLTNRGEDHARVLAGLFDAVCENVQSLIKPRGGPDELVLVGGVSRSRRVGRSFGRFAERHGLRLRIEDDDRGLFLEALGAATTAAAAGGESDHPANAALGRPPSVARLLAQAEHGDLERFAPLRGHLQQVRRLDGATLAPDTGSDPGSEVVLGFDMGSTGSKLVALDRESLRPIWEGYTSTSGDPVSAAQTLVRRLVEHPTGARPVSAFGATGSGREIVGSMLATCFGAERVYILNEIAAHAEGSLHLDPRVDTIFEIGGQDAKYIRLSHGRVVDAAMNEACSAGTGSFIEEQGRCFAGVLDVHQLAAEALAADHGVALGQHCSVFMAEVIDEAIAAGAGQRSIIAGIYDSIVQNYLNRVKGGRPVGQVVFCQGMPFAEPALAAAVARQTGSEIIVPPNPGTIGALGIALLTARAIPSSGNQPIDLSRFLKAEVAGTDEIICSSTKGCGETSNHCRIARLTTRVNGRRLKFTWGGGCSLWDRGTWRARLPDGTPDLFTQREQMITDLLERFSPRGHRPRVAVADGLQISELLPFLVAFIHGLGLDPVVSRGSGPEVLRRGIEDAAIPYCAPLQQMHGLLARALEHRPDLVLLPMLRGRVAAMARDDRRLPTARAAGEDNGRGNGATTIETLCPMVQATPDLLWATLEEEHREIIVSPVLDMGPGDLRSARFAECCRLMARSLGITGRHWRKAFDDAVAVQAGLETERLRQGEQALELCRSRSLVPIVVLGRPYTIYDRLLNSNVPALLREQGALAIPVDCYPLDPSGPGLEAVYWSHGRRNLRAAHQIRHSPGVWSLWCSNYSCGPDSFNLAFYAHLMDGKPFAIIETDGHSGDAGTKTRIEAFLHCVREDSSRAHSREERDQERETAAPSIHGSGIKPFARPAPTNLARVRDQGERVLVPAMGPGAEVLAACLQGIGVQAEALPVPTRETLRLGRRYTSGKECLPMIVTLGGLLERIEQARGSEDRFVFLMPSTRGPCRFGVYNLLHQIVLDRLGWSGRVRLWSPLDESYFDGLPVGFSALVLAGLGAQDTLLEGLHQLRPALGDAEAAERIYAQARTALIDHLRSVAASTDLGARALARELATGSLHGVTGLLREAATSMADAAGLQPGVPGSRPEPAPDQVSPGTAGQAPTVALAGEIYLRCDPFSNDLVIERLEQRGLRVHLAPLTEWIEYSDLVNHPSGWIAGIGARLETLARRRVLDLTHAAMAEALGWPQRATASKAIRAAHPWVRRQLRGEAILTVGGPLHMWHQGRIDGALTVAPLECMPGKIAEAQLLHASRELGMPFLALSLHGDPICDEQLDSFAFDVHHRHGA